MSERETRADAEHWQAALRLYEALLDLPAEARAEALSRADAAPEARERAARMLAQDGRPGLLDRPLPRQLLPGAVAAEQGDALIGRRLGRWLLLDRLGQGGMATVYRARSLQPPLDQIAALKLLSLAAATPAGRVRFEREIDILVRLRHPGIAPVFDAGIAADGTPWFAMALVEGVSIDAWCQEQGLDVDRRVALLLQVCDAVEHAHRHLVIHRDIKPGNVLVDRDGRAVLLDFGISRLLDDAATRSGEGYAFTPRFAAPEQLSGGDISTASDVFSLACLLHALLLGAPPQWPDGDGECRDPAALARRDSDHALRRALRGDLGHVLRRALARDPARRYPTVAAFAADLRAWREGRPVSAHHDGGFYRLRRFVGRHKLASGLTAALALSLVAGIAGVAWQAEDARRQAARANLTREFLLEIFAEADLMTRGTRPPDIRLVLEKAASQAPQRFTERPELQADILYLVGRLQRLNMDNRAAVGTLRTALALDERSGAPWTDERRRAARTLSQALRMLGEREEAGREAQAWMAADPEAPALTSPVHCGGLLDLPDQTDHERRERLESAWPRCRTFPVGSRERMMFVTRLSQVRRATGDPEGALAVSGAEDAAVAALPNLDPTLWSDWTVLKAELALTLAALDRHEESAEVSAASIRLAERHAGPDSAFVVGLLRVHGARLSDLGRHDEAQAALERAWTINQRLGDGRIRSEDPALLFNLGANAMEAGRHQDAIGYWERCLEAMAGSGQQDHTHYGITLRLISESQRALDDFAGATETASQAVAFLELRHPKRTDLRSEAEFAYCLALAGLSSDRALSHCRRGTALAGESGTRSPELLEKGRQAEIEASGLLER